MLRAVAIMAQEYNLPCQVSLEEHMACAVGGGGGLGACVGGARAQAAVNLAQYPFYRARGAVSDLPQLHG